jgi:hypothetical protein
VNRFPGRPDRDDFPASFENIGIDNGQAVTKIVESRKIRLEQADKSLEFSSGIASNPKSGVTAPTSRPNFADQLPR